MNVINVMKKNIELNALINSFSEKISVADEALKSNSNINAVVNNSLVICQTLCSNLPFDKYSEIHSGCIAYFASLKKYLSNRKIYSVEEINHAFELSLRCPSLVPRIYVALAVACSSEDENQLTQVIKMLPSVSHPLRGLFLRFTAISLFPTKSVVLGSFSISNFDEMIYLLPDFLKLYPESIIEASSWITSNISLSLFLNKQDNELIRKYFEISMTFPYKEVIISIIDCISQSLEKNELAKLYENFSMIISKMEQSPDLKRITMTICKNLCESRSSFEFIIKTPYSKEFAIDITNMAIEQNQIDVIHDCAKQWPHESVLLLIFQRIGHEEFSNVIDCIENGMEIVIKFVESFLPSISPHSLRKVLMNEMVSRSSNLNKTLTKMLEKYDFSADFFRIVFSEPFVIIGDRFLKVLFYKCLSKGVENEFIIKFIKRSSNISNQVYIVLFSLVLPESDFCEIINYIDDPTTMKIALSHSSRFNICIEDFEKIFNKIKDTKDKIFICGTIMEKGFIERAQQEFELIIRNEGCSLYDAIDNFFLIINICYCHIKNIDITFLSNIFQLILDILISKAHPLFPISTQENNHKWLSILNLFQNKLGTNETIIQISNFLI